MGYFKLVDTFATDKYIASRNISFVPFIAPKLVSSAPTVVKKSVKPVKFCTISNLSESVKSLGSGDGPFINAHCKTSSSLKFPAN